MQNAKNNNDGLLHEHGLAFFGSITASTTHELNNVMSIIEQNAGLLEDLCAGTEYGRPLEPEKLREISEKIQRQIQRGVVIIKRLNYFAHSVDEPLATVQLNTLVSNIVDICQRFAILKKLNLRGDYPSEEITLQSNPFILEQAIFTCINQTMDLLEKDGLLTVSFKRDESRIIIAVTGSPAEQDIDRGAIKNLLELLVKQIDGNIEETSENNNISYTISIPR